MFAETRRQTRQLVEWLDLIGFGARAPSSQPATTTVGRPEFQESEKVAHREAR